MIPEPSNENAKPVETDERFPSGPWKGFFLQPPSTRRHWMDLSLTFRDGVMHGEGSDRIGKFLIRGKYDVKDGKCWWSKRYIGMHDVAYQGYNEGKGIWGLWEIVGYGAPTQGGFHIWPVAMGDPTVAKLHAAEEIPAPAPEPEGELVGAGSDVGSNESLGAGA